MSKTKSLQRQIARNNNKLLGSYGNQLKPGWALRPQGDRDIVADMARNGITVADLEREFKRGRDSAFQDTAPLVMKQCYAAFATVLADEFDFSPDDCFKVVYMADQKIMTAIDLEDALFEMGNKCRIQFRSDEGIERVVQI